MPRPSHRKSWASARTVDTVRGQEEGKALLGLPSAVYSVQDHRPCDSAVGRLHLESVFHSQASLDTRSQTHPQASFLDD